MDPLVSEAIESSQRSTLTLNWQQRSSWKPGTTQMQFLAQENAWDWFLAARRGDPWKTPHWL
jgi:hypothetical protein